MPFKSLDFLLNHSDDKKVSSQFLRIISHWPNIVGEKLAATTLPQKLINHKLIVVTKHSSISQHLNLMSGMIVAKIHSQFPVMKKEVQSIQFKVNPSLFDSMVEERIQVSSTQNTSILETTPDYLIKNAKQFFNEMEEGEEKNSLISIYIQLHNPK